MSIQKIVSDALLNGLLTNAQERHIRLLMGCQPTETDLLALANLNQALIEGQISFENQALVGG